MTTTNINVRKVRMTDGTRVLIASGSNLLSVLSTRPGSFFEYTPGLKEIIHETEKGRVSTTPQNGDENPTDLKLMVWGTASVGATELETMLSDVENSTPDGYRKLFDIYIEIPTFDGATAGKLYRFRYCAVKPRGLSIKGGSSFDEFDIELTDFEAKPSITAFVALLTAPL